MSLEVFQPEHLNALSGNGFDRVYPFIQQNRGKKGLFGTRDNFALNVLSLFEGDDLMSVRRVDAEAAAEVTQLLAFGGIIIMRHGAQFSADSSKIRMMQLPQNYTDPMTHVSMAEGASVAHQMAIFSNRTQLPVEIMTSKNIRAKQLAHEISAMTRGNDYATSNLSNLSHKEALDCVNYPSDKTDEEINAILGPEAKGSLPWDKIDALLGEGTTDVFLRNMGGIINGTLEKIAESRKMVVIVTHTQQTNAVDLLFDQQQVRYSELGFSIVWLSKRPKGRAAVMYTQYPNGIFLPKAA